MFEGSSEPQDLKAISRTDKQLNDRLTCFAIAVNNHLDWLAHSFSRVTYKLEENTINWIKQAIQNWWDYWNQLESPLSVVMSISTLFQSRFVDMHYHNTLWRRMRVYCPDCPTLGIASFHLARHSSKSLLVDADRGSWIDTHDLVGHPQRLLVTNTLVIVLLNPSPRNISLFRPIAVGALVTTLAACLLIVIQSALDSQDLEEVVFPAPTLEGTFKAFGSIMFAFAGASTFPTIQADMKHREQFNKAATIACGSESKPLILGLKKEWSNQFVVVPVLFLIYFPMAAGGYFSFGHLAKANIVLSISDGPVRLIVEIMLLLHLVAAFPIITNPPAQFFEYMLGIPTGMNKLINRVRILQNNR